MGKVYICGEALIDFVPTESELGMAFAPFCGGSPYNAGKAAARLGAEVEFLGPISSDMFGDDLAADLKSAGVGVGRAPRPDYPTTLAFVKFDGSDARYVFNNAQTATQLADYKNQQLELTKTDILHVGSISLIDDPGGANTEKFALANAEQALLSVDPNARPGMTKDKKAWQTRIGNLINAASIVKLSDEDLDYYAPSLSPEDFAAQLVSEGVSIAVVTLGAGGALAATASGQSRVPGHSGDLKDTVGAGDTVTGVLLTELAGLARDEISAMNSTALERLIKRAMAAAWLNCQFAGCNPPDKSALDAFIKA